MISQRARNIPASKTLEITAKVKAMKAGGKSVIAFTAGEPDFNTPEEIIASAKTALDQGKTKYTPASGIKELKEAICKKLLNDNNLTYSAENIVVCDGAKSCLYHALYALVDEGDEVIIPSPYWVTYAEQVRLCGGKCVFVEGKKENSYKITAEQLEDAITDKTKCLILNSPCNPTGAVYTEKQTREIAEVLERRNVYCISDEIYEKLVYDGNKTSSIAAYSEKMKNLTITVNGLSKTYSMTGWRVGYLACEKSIAKAISNVQSHTTSNACSFCQYASVTALAMDESKIAKMVYVFDERRKHLIMEVNKLPSVGYCVPEGAFYLFLDVSAYYGKSIDGRKIEGSSDFAIALLDFGVGVIPGLAFGDDACLRLSYTLPEEQIGEGIKRIAAFLASLE